MLGHQSLLVYKILDLYIPLMAFDILRFKLKKKNNDDKKKNWRSGFLL